MARRRTLRERLAMELYQIFCEEAAGQKNHPYGLTAEQSWARITDLLRDGYRDDARRLLQVVYAWQRYEPAGSPQPAPASGQEGDDA